MDRIFTQYEKGVFPEIVLRQLEGRMTPLKDVVKMPVNR